MERRSSNRNDTRRESAGDGQLRRLVAPRAESSLLVAFARGAAEAAPRRLQVEGAASGESEADYIPLSEHFRLLRQLTETSRDEALHLSKRPLAPGTTDFVIDTLLQAKDLEDAMKRAARA